MNAKNNVNQGRVIGLYITTVLCCSLHLITSVLRTHHNVLHTILKGELRNINCMVSRSINTKITDSKASFDMFHKFRFQKSTKKRSLSIYAP